MANPYLQVLRTPHALPMVLAAFIGRLPLSMVGLGCVLLVASETGSYGLGGAVAAVGAVTTALAGPLLGRLADTPRPAAGAAAGAGGLRRLGRDASCSRCKRGLAAVDGLRLRRARPAPASRRSPR